MSILHHDTAFIILALPRWDGHYSSTSFSLSKEIAKSHPVFYIDNPFTVKDFMMQFGEPRVKRRARPLLFGQNIYTPLKLKKGKLTVVTPKLVFPINWIDNHRLYDVFSGLNNRRVNEVLQKIVKDHQLKDYIFINSYNPFYSRSFPSDFAPRLSIYHTVDDISEAKYVKKHGTRLEKEAVQKADFTITTSVKLRRLKVEENPDQPVYFLPNAVDTSIFMDAHNQDLPMPTDLPNWRKDIIIYTGHIDQRIDIPLLQHIASNYQDKTLLLVGHISLNKENQKALQKFENIVFTGKKAITELPAYLRLAQCAIIPFKCNKLTESIYPLKINEYLMSGLPVVTTPFSEDIKAFSDLAYVSATPEAFVQNIHHAILENSDEKKQKRIAGAQQNNWASRVTTLFGWIEKHIKEKDHEASKN